MYLHSFSYELSLLQDMQMDPLTQLRYCKCVLYFTFTGPFQDIYMILKGHLRIRAYILKVAFLQYLNAYLLYSVNEVRFHF